MNDKHEKEKAIQSLLGHIYSGYINCRKLSFETMRTNTNKMIELKKVIAPELYGRISPKLFH
jgi:hypothetical protein